MNHHLWAFVVYALSSLGLGWLARRSVPAVSRRALVVLVLLPLCFTGRAFLTGSIFAPVDLSVPDEQVGLAFAEHGVGNIHRDPLLDVRAALIPWRKAVRAAVRNGEWPLWNPFMLGGDILAACAQPAAYHPISLVSLVLPLEWSLNYWAAMTFFVAGFGGFLFLRELGCRERVAVTGAAGWMYSSFILMWHQFPHGVSVAMLGWVMLGVRRVCVTPGLRSTGLLTAAFTSLLLAGHPETTVHVIAVSLVYGVYELTVMDPSQRPLAIGGSLAAAAVALLLAAVYMLPLIEALPQTGDYARRLAVFQSTGRSVAFSDSLRRLVTSVVPFFFGVYGRETVSLPAWFVPYSSAYAGSLLFAPAFLGLWKSRWRGRWVLFALGGLGVLAGASVPGVSDLLGRLPLFAVSINKRLTFVGAFAVCVLAALGLDVCMREGSSRLLAGLYVLTAALVGCAILATRPAMAASGLSAGFLWRDSLVSLLPMVAAAALLLTVPSRVWGVALFVLLLGQRYAEMGNFCPTIPAGAFNVQAKLLEGLPRDGTPYRIVAFGDRLLPNSATFLELEDVRGYQPMGLARRLKTDRLWSTRHSLFFGRVSEAHPFLSFLNVRYALVGREARPDGWRIVAEEPERCLVEDPHALERAFIPATVKTRRRPERVLREMARARDFGQTAWIEIPEEIRRDIPDNGPGTIRIHRRGSGYLLSVHMDGPGWIVVSETAWKGWQARCRGRAIPLHIANHAYLGFHLPAGDHDVELFYRPRSFVIGRAISLSTIGVLLALLAWRTARRRGQGGGADRPVGRTDGRATGAGDSRSAEGGGHAGQASGSG